MVILTWIIVVILELIHAPKPDFLEGLCLLVTKPTHASPALPLPSSMNSNNSYSMNSNGSHSMNSNNSYSMNSKSSYSMNSNNSSSINNSNHSY